MIESNLGYHSFGIGNSGKHMLSPPVEPLCYAVDVLGVCFAAHRQIRAVSASGLPSLPATVARTLSASMNHGSRALRHVEAT